MDLLAIVVIAAVVLACPIGMHLMMRRNRKAKFDAGPVGAVPPPEAETDSASDQPRRTAGFQ